MNKGELMEYLKAVCAAESAIYACDEANAVLKKELERSWTYIPVPTEPVEEHTPKVQAKDNLPWGCGCLFGAVGGLAGFGGGAYAPGNWSLLAIPLGGMLGMILGMMLPMVISMLVTEADAKYETEKLKQKARERHEQAKEKYNEELSMYNECVRIQKEAKDAVEKSIRQEMAKNEAARGRIKSSLEQLYSRNIIYPSFRDMVAVHQMSEYLAMGVCDELEGPNGAYALYLRELQTNRICNSIDELKKSMLSAMGQLIAVQGRVIYELRATNDNMLNMQTAMQNSLNGIQNEISAVHNSMNYSNAAITTSVNEINEKIGSMNQAIQVGAHNQYIEMREREANAYIRNHLLKAPTQYNSIW